MPGPLAAKAVDLEPAAMHAAQAGDPPGWLKHLAAMIVPLAGCAAGLAVLLRGQAFVARAATATVFIDPDALAGLTGTPAAPDGQVLAASHPDLAKAQLGCTIDGVPARITAGLLIAGPDGFERCLVLAFDRSGPGERAGAASLAHHRAAAALPPLVAIARDLLTMHHGLDSAKIELDEQMATLRASRDSEKLLIDYLLTASDGVWQTDAAHRFVSTTTDLSTLHLSQERVFGKTAWELASADPKDPLWAPLLAAFEARRPFRGFEYSLRDDRAAILWREVNGNPIFGPDGGFRGFRGTSRDVTARKQAEISLREMNSRLSALARSGIVGIIVGEGDWIVETNDEFLRILGFDRDDLVDGRLHFPLLSPPGSRHAEIAFRRELDAQGVVGPVEWEYLRKDGNRVPVLVSSIMLERAERRWMGLVQDISERKRAEARIRELADRDTLTGLFNRRSFMERFAETLAGVPKKMGGGALILLDLDHFKDVNDTLGHDAGDALLCEVAQRIARCVRQGDAVARLGGDEFAVLLTDIADTDEIGAIGRRILEHLRRPFRYDARLLHASASAGIVLFPTDGLDAKQLLKSADIALYRSKARGRRTINFFDPYMLVEYEDRLALDTELQRALADREFALAYQPTVRVEDRGHAGFEALLRWAHPTRGLLAPASFVANLEQSGLIVAVGRFVLDNALAQLRAWLDLGFEPGHIAVNVAAAQLRQGDLVRDVEQQLGLYRLEAARLRVEITENVLLEDCPEITATLEGLHRLGVGIALDDFGTGFASLSHLKRVPVDVLKIDRSFVRDIGVDADDAAISRTIITLAHSLGMSVVAEGVASEDALAFLRLNGCNEAQGYLFAKPLAAQDAEAYMTGALVPERH